MQGHQLDRVFKLVRLGFAGIQRGGVQKLLQHRQLVFLGGIKHPAGVDQFLQVFLPGLTFFAFFLAMKFQQPGFIQYQLGDVAQGFFRTVIGERVDQLHKAFERIRRPGGQGVVGNDLRRGLPQGQVLIAGALADRIQGFATDAPGGRIDHPLETRIVIGVGDQAHIGQGVFDFQAFVEALAAIDAISNALAQQRFFQHPGLGVGAIQNGGAGVTVALLDPVFDALDDKPRFILFVERGVECDRLAIIPVGPQLFAQATEVVGNHRIGGLQDGTGGAVVLFQADGLGAREVIGKALNVFNARAAPAINGLVIVAHGGDLGRLTGEHPQPGVLNAVGVLEFVHQNKRKTALVMLQDVGLVQPQLVSAQQQFGKVHQATALAVLLVGTIDHQHGANIRIAVVRDVLGA